MDILASLTDAQRVAVTHVEGPMLVLAGPGSGKTRVVTHRIAHLLREGVWPSQILALTFTNKAADEMSRRIERMAPGRRVWVSTFHRFCARLLREFAPLVGLEANFSIYDADASVDVVKRAIDEADVRAKFVTPDRIARRISAAKGDLVSAEQMAECARDPLTTQVAHVYPVYQKLLLKANAVDFDDLLVHVATLLRDNEALRSALDGRYRFVLVDEYQDTNAAQFAIVRGLSVDHPNLAVTGDPDQSIYGWRGASIRNILDFESKYPKARVVRLEENFRSSRRIVGVAAHLIAFNKNRKPKTLFTHNAIGERVRLARYASWTDEAQDIGARIAAEVAAGRRPGDFAVFFRINALSRSIEQALRVAGVPYQVVRGLEFYKRREIKDLLAYLHLLNNPRDDEAFRRAIQTPPRGVGRQTLARLDLFARDAGMSLPRAAREPALQGLVGARPAASLRAFTQLVDRLVSRVGSPVEQILRAIVEETGFREYLKEAEDLPDVDRWANVEEFLSEAREFDANQSEGPWLEAFLERAALFSDTDQWDAEASRVSLMTLHAAKGLEFPSVFIIGLEEGLLPHERSRYDADGLEEERRLFFVGITRARESLQISHADLRMWSGNSRYTVTSSFLSQLPVSDLELAGYGPFGARHRANASPGRGDPRPAPGSDAWDAIDEEPPDDVVTVEVNEREGRAKTKPSDDGGATRIRTASDLGGAGTARRAKEASRREKAERFSEGMLVKHPDYGLGRIVALSGSGAKRMATIRFFAEPDRDHRFQLAFSALIPVGAPTQ
ncbi:MAG: AAA family ATPase [Planctomycetes bacterium]|nr:AAA family ATPase [Planctomycetota bacterium]